MWVALLACQQCEGQQSFRISDATFHRRRVKHFEETGNLFMRGDIWSSSRQYVYDNWEGDPGLPVVTRLNPELIAGCEPVFERRGFSP